MARIELQKMQFYAYHGCYTQEQRVGNRFQVDLWLDYDSVQAQKSDSISDAVNYLDIYQIVSSQMEVKSHILEHVSRRIIDAIKSAYPNITHIEVKVTKLAPPLGGSLEGVSATVRE